MALALGIRFSSIMSNNDDINMQREQYKTACDKNWSFTSHLLSYCILNNISNYIYILSNKILVKAMKK